MRAAVILGFASFGVVVLVTGCDGSTTVSTCKDSIEPGVACNDPTLCCRWSGTECGTCACNGSSFECQMNSCSPTQLCPEPAGLTSGQPCGAKSGCTNFQAPPESCKSSASIYACGASCSCSSTFGSGVWECHPLECPDAGADVSDADSDSTDF